MFGQRSSKAPATILDAVFSHARDGQTKVSPGGRRGLARRILHAGLLGQVAVCLYCQRAAIAGDVPGNTSYDDSWINDVSGKLVVTR